jgi:hypothetical protein
MGSGLEPLPDSKTASAISEVSRAVSSPQEGGQAGQVSPMSSVWITGEAPVGEVQAMRRAAKTQVTPERGSKVLRRLSPRNLVGSLSSEPVNEFDFREPEWTVDWIL